jgi:hypothetical protein
MLGSFTHLDGLMLQNEHHHQLYENPNKIPRLGDLLIHTKFILLKGFVEFFKPEHSNNLQEGDRIVRLKFSRSEGHVVSLKLYKNGEGVLVWLFASANDIQFNINLTIIEPWHWR